MCSAVARGAAAFRAIALGGLLAAGCGPTGAAPDFEVHRTGVVVRSEVAFARRPDLAARIDSTVSAALDYWGGGWSDLAGTTITLVDGRYVECGGVAGATGCYDGDVRVSTTDLGAPFACVEQTTLVHEIGHAVVGDPGHRDPRWMEFESLAAALSGRIGYAASGHEMECAIAVSVWRHPPGP